jgi:integrase
MRFRTPSGRIAKLTLGPHDRAPELTAEQPVIGQPLTLQAARQLAAWVHRQRALGRDVAADHKVARHRARIESESLANNTFGVAVRNYAEEYARPNLRLWRKTARYLGLDYPLKDDAAPTETRNGLAERWADKPVADIDESDIFEVIEEAKRVGVPGIVVRKKGLSEVRARSFFVALSSMFSWLKKNRRIKVNPCSGITRPSGGGKRDRELTHDEARWFWTACETVGAPSDTPRPYAPVLKLLLLTGQRPNEVAGMTRHELHDDASWHLPGTRTKNKLPHIVPLAPLARELIATMPPSGHLVFTTNHKTPMGGWSRLKGQLDASMLVSAKKERGPNAKIEPWQLRDLRRTAVTGMRKLGVPSDLVELIINHVSGHKAGVAGVYDVAELLPERKEALEKWARFIALVVDNDLYNAHKKFLAHGDEKLRQKTFKEAISEGGEHWQRYLSTVTTDGQTNVVPLPRGAA